MARTAIQSTGISKADLDKVTQDLATTHNFVESPLTGLTDDVGAAITAQAGVLKLVDANVTSTVVADGLNERYLRTVIPNNQFHPLTALGAKKMRLVEGESKALLAGLQNILPGSVFADGKWGSPLRGLEGGLKGGLSADVIAQNLLGVTGTCFFLFI